MKQGKPKGSSGGSSSKKSSKSKIGSSRGLSFSAPTGSSAGLGRVLLLIGAVVIFVLVFFAAYRSVGYVAINKTYACVEDDINSINYINTLVDMEAGVILEDADVIQDAVDEGKNLISGRECGGGTAVSLAGDLTDMQGEVEDAAVGYLDAVSLVAEKEVQEENTLLNEKYNEFRIKVLSFEDAVDEAESKFFVAL